MGGHADDEDGGAPLVNQGRNTREIRTRLPVGDDADRACGRSDLLPDRDADAPQAEIEREDGLR